MNGSYHDAYAASIEMCVHTATKILKKQTLPGINKNTSITLFLNLSIIYIVFAVDTRVQLSS